MTLWTPPNIHPDTEDVYQVLAGTFRRWMPNEGEYLVEDVMFSHWDARHGWGKPQATPETALTRRYSVRQDFPWRVA